MQLTKNHKRIGGVIAFCVVAIVLDRTVLSPQDADAGDAPAPPVVAPRPPTPTRTATDVPPPTGVDARAALARSFNALARDHGLDTSNPPDVFRTPASWGGRPGPVLPTVVTDETARRFSDTHTLGAVMARGDGGSCIVDGRSLRVGQSLDGFRLVRLKPRAAVFESEGGIVVELTLPEVGGSAGSP